MRGLVTTSLFLAGITLANAGEDSQISSSSKSSSSSVSSSSNSHHSMDLHDMHVHVDPHLPAHDDSRLHPEHDEYNECKYAGEWGDCDPFKMIRVKELQLIVGDTSCVDKKNITKPCSREDFPPGTIWLLKQHKQCVLELQKLKTMIEDLHRYIDLIHQRGQALFNAYNELRKHLMDIRRELSNLGRLNHAAEQTIVRLKTELEEWKVKSNKMTMELNELKQEYKQLEDEVRADRHALAECQKTKEEKAAEQAQLNQQLYDIRGENRDLKSRLLDAERYKEELREILEAIGETKTKIAGVNLDIKKTKDELDQCKVDGIQAMKMVKKGPKINKDTKVDLDMSMWITHNITQEEGQEMYYQPIQYGEDPAKPYK